MNNDNQSQQGNSNTQINYKGTITQNVYNLKDYYDVDTRYIIYPLGPYEDQDIQCYVFNIFNQFLKQNLSFCEIDKPLRNYKERYFAKLQPEVDIHLIPKIIDDILLPITNHIKKCTEKDKNLDSLYDETMDLIKYLNSIKID